MRVRVPRRAGRWSIYDVCADDGGSLVLQSPLLTMPYTPIRDDGGNFSADMCLYNANAVASVAFFDDVDRLCAQLKHRLCTHDPRLTSWSWPGCVREADGGYERRLRLKGCDAWIHAFDINGAPCHFKDVKRDDRLRALIHVRQVVADEETRTVVVRLDLVQVQRMEPVFSTLVAAAAAAAPTPLPEHLVKYQRMLKSGVAKEAVEHKMTMDGCAHDAPLLLKPDAACPQPRAPPPPPLFPPQGLFAAIKGLKRPGSQNQQSKSAAAAAHKTPAGPQPPSLADILAAKGGLRPLKK